MNQRVDGFTMILSVTMILPVWNSFITFLSQWQDISSPVFSCLVRIIPVICTTMRSNVFLIVLLMAMVVAAPVVDALVCDDCNDIIPLPDMQRLSNGAGQSGGPSLSSVDAHPSTQGTATAQELCPVCSDTAAAIISACCGAPFMISNTKHLPKLLALSSPSYPINKPPQN
jgi:hypothetical protein